MKVNPRETHLSRLFFQKGTPRHLSNGRLLQLRGSSDQILYYIVKGHVLLHLWSLVGRELAIDVLGAGGLVGIGALRAEPSHHLDATTLGECTLNCLPAKTLQFELSHDAELCFELFRWTNEQLARRASQLEEIALSNLDSRIARVLINQFDAQEVPVKEGEEISFPSQQWLANLIGSSRESVNKELKRLHEGGIITVSRQKVRILDATKLKQQADPNAAPYCINPNSVHKPEKYPWLTRLLARPPPSLRKSSTSQAG
jgi:CRP/FNR family cyclic AMP-dependent transcriptional regulator